MMTLNHDQPTPGKGVAIDEAGGQDQLYREEAPAKWEVENTAISYRVRDNRAPREMRVWLRARNR